MGVVQGHTGIGGFVTVAVRCGSGRTVHGAPGARVGDRVEMCDDTMYTTTTDVSERFERFVSEENHIVQLDGDLGGHTVAIVLVRPT